MKNWLTFSFTIRLLVIMMIAVMMITLTHIESEPGNLWFAYIGGFIYVALNIIMSNASFEFSLYKIERTKESRSFSTSVFTNTPTQVFEFHLFTLSHILTAAIVAVYVIIDNYSKALSVSHIFMFALLFFTSVKESRQVTANSEFVLKKKD